jgi:hypothetical protein
LEKYLLRAPAGVGILFRLDAQISRRTSMVEKKSRPLGFNEFELPKNTRAVKARVQPSAKPVRTTASSTVAQVWYKIQIQSTGI